MLIVGVVNIPIIRSGLSVDRKLYFAESINYKQGTVTKKKSLVSTKNY